MYKKLSPMQVPIWRIPYIYWKYYATNIFSIKYKKFSEKQKNKSQGSGSMMLNIMWKLFVVSFISGWNERRRWKVRVCEQKKERMQEGAWLRRRKLTITSELFRYVNSVSINLNTHRNAETCQHKYTQLTNSCCSTNIALVAPLTNPRWNNVASESGTMY